MSPTPRCLTRDVLSLRLEDCDGAQPRLNAGTPKPDTGGVSAASVRSWRYGLVPLVALFLPALWLVDGGSATEGIAAAITGLAVSSVGAYLVWLFETGGPTRCTSSSRCS